MSDLSDTQIIERVEARLDQRTPRSRIIEDVLAIVGIAQAVVYGVVESAAAAGWRLGNCAAETGFPWVTVIIFLGCVLPKTVGRGTAGKIWEFAAGRFGAKP